MRNLNYSSGIFFFASLILISLSQFFLFIGEPKYIVVIAAFIFVSYLFFSEYKNLILILAASIFYDHYFFWPMRLQVVTIVSYVLIFYYFTNSKTSYFNSFGLPMPVKFSAGILISAVFLSAINSKFFSIQSLFLAFVFLVFMTTSYVVFKLPKNDTDVFKYLKYFVLASFITSLTIVFQIALTGNLRSVGLAGFPIMDLLVITLLILVFNYFILGKYNSKIIFVTIITFCTLITTQSRFSWLGFIVSFIYGLLICFRKEPLVFNILKKRFSLLLLAFFLVAGISIVLGLDKVLISRFSDVRLNFFQGESEGELSISNSLETRILIWLVAYNMFLDNLWTGVGYLMFSNVSINYNILPGTLYEFYVENLDAHTTYFNILTETGIIGFICFVSYLITMFSYSYKAIKIAYNIYSRKISIILHIIVFFTIFHSIYSGAFTFGTNAYAMHFIFGLTIFNYVYLLKKKDYEAK